MTITVRQFFKLFPNDEACLEHLFLVRYGQGHVCPNCERAAKWYPIKATRAYACQWCGWHLHPTAGTLFEATRTPLQLWFYAIYLFTTSRHGVPAKELERQLGVTYKTAWRMAHELRKLMASAAEGDGPLSGHVEADEAYVGGKRSGGKRGRGAEGKAIVFGMAERGGDVRAEVVPDVKARTIEPIIVANVEPGSTISTDELGTYNRLAERGYEHGLVRHGAREFVDGVHHVNSVEGFWSRLKLSIRGTHVHVSAKHLPKYVSEFAFRYNMRDVEEPIFGRLLRSL